MKVQSNAYTGMLLISVLALAIGGTLLFLDFTSYGSVKPASASVPNIAGR